MALNFSTTPKNSRVSGASLSLTRKFTFECTQTADALGICGQQRAALTWTLLLKQHTPPLKQDLSGEITGFSLSDDFGRAIQRVRPLACVCP
jgi:hypothetical protein